MSADMLADSDPFADVKVGDAIPSGTTTFVATCPADSDDDWACSRYAGHPGNHIAFGNSKVCAVWPQETSLVSGAYDDIRGLTDQRDLARSVAVALEQENAHLLAALRLIRTYACDSQTRNGDRLASIRQTLAGAL